MTRQYQIPGGPYVNVEGDGREYALPGYGFLNTAAGVPILSAATVINISATTAGPQVTLTF